MEDLNEVIRLRREKAEQLRESGVSLYPNSFRPSHRIEDIHRIIKARNGSEDIAEMFSAAGRIVGLRSFGKAAFLHIRDGSGRIQVYVKKDEVGEESYRIFKKIEVGDFLGVEGTLFQTKTGEWTLSAKDFQLLCKAIRPLPEKFHGLKDPEKRYRRRYLDLIMNAHVRDIFLKRTQIIDAFRRFLLERDFLEVETPMMQPIPGGAEATPFKTHHNALGEDLFLRIAPELYLKRLIIGGMDRVFEINRNFRNEGISTRHNPEFTMLEFYMAYKNYQDLMTLTEQMFRFVIQSVLGKLQFSYQGFPIDVEAPWRRVTLKNALIELGGLDPSILNDRLQLLKFAESKGIQITKQNSLGKILTKLFDVLVQPELISPTFVLDYPLEISPLARKTASDPEITERFELFIGGNEIANGFSELNDPVDQKDRFLQQARQRQAGDEEAHLMDEDYVQALEYGMPPTAGEGIGMDRFVMLLTDVPSIREVILFPLLKRSGNS